MDSGIYKKSIENETLGERLKRLRLENNFTQKHVADALNIDRSTYTYYENGKTEPNYTSTIKLARIFNVSVQEIITGEKVEIVATPDNAPKVISVPDNETRMEGDLLSKFRSLSGLKRHQLLETATNMIEEENKKRYIYKNKD